MKHVHIPQFYLLAITSMIGFLSLSADEQSYVHVGTHDIAQVIEEISQFDDNSN
jgi:hypothetical protein